MNNQPDENKIEQSKLGLDKQDMDISENKENRTDQIGNDFEQFKLFIEEKKQQITRMFEELEVANKNLKETTTNYGERAFAIEKDNLKKQEELLIKEKEKIEEEKGKLLARENDVSLREAEAKNSFQDYQKKLKDDYDKKEEDLEKHFNDLSAKKQNEYDKRIEELEKRFADLTKKRQNEYDQKTEELENRFNDLTKRKQIEYEKKCDELEKSYLKKQEELQNSLEKESLNRKEALNNELESKKRELEESIKRNEEDRKRNEEDRLKNENEYKRNELRAEQLDLQEDRIEDTVNDRISMIKEEFVRKEELYNEHIQSLQQDNQLNLSIINDFNDLKSKLGGEDPSVVLNQLKDLQKYNQELRDKLSSIPTVDTEKKIELLQIENNQLRKLSNDYVNKCRVLYEHVQPVEDLKTELEHKEMECQRLNSEYQATLAHCAQIESELSRLKNVYGSSEERAERLKAITAEPDIKYPNQESFKVFDSKISEINWLEHIINNINEYGLSFPRRLVYAFHTCLKTAEWSPITVLAGVSGTGKSELPRFYSLFGGLKFLPVSVQPNWDSQESMLGFFNTIDNKFDAQPLLKFLFQVTKEKTEEYPHGLRSSMNMVLLDEMNLAHIELYFAEFLSKLESRRGRKGKGDVDLPAIDVKLGANIEPYKIPLTRNLLWVGTMNQDETTKALSDKVLDRGNVLFFPRPVELKRREKVKALPSDVNYLLPYKVWTKWAPFESIFTAEQIEPYKKIVEKINASLEVVGRAIGHRVWQSIEYYMSNYPTVRVSLNDKEKLEKNMDIAFADALVQKVMPKLRGIETRGIGKEECLDRINQILGERELGLQEDFNKACENAYGQFIWNSANYLLDDSALVPEGNHNDDNVSIPDETSSSQNQSQLNSERVQ